MIIHLPLPVLTEPLCPVSSKTQDTSTRANGATLKSFPWILKVQWLIFNSLPKKTTSSLEQGRWIAMLWNEVLHMLQWLENTIGPTQQTIERPSASANLVQQKTSQNTKRFELCLHHSWSIRDYQFHFRLRTEPAFFSVMQSRQTRAAAPPGR